MLALIIMDGYGNNPEKFGNAIAEANTPVLDKLFRENPNTQIKCSGMDVGLPEGQMGNSEVGHTNVGAGRVVYQELTRITKSITDGDFFNNEGLLTAIENCKKNGTSLHLIGLLSNGGVHSHNTHLYAILELAKRQGLSKVYVHCMLDGRDVPPDSGLGFVKELQAEIEKIGVGEIATVMGRYYAMDRDKRWDRVEKGYKAMVNGDGEVYSSATEAVRASYQNEVTDEFVLPSVVMKNGAPVAKVSENDSIIFFNFRPDRAREITRTFVDKDFDGFSRTYFPVCYICMTQYDEEMPNVTVAFKPTALINTFGEYISEKGLKQLRIAETEKYAHVTFFFNGGVEQEYPGEERALIPSPKVATYDLKPEMSAFEVTDEAVKRIKSGKYDVIVLNFANCDMVGHTGVMQAAIKAVETVDTCLGRTVEAIHEMGGVALITADHGNAEVMVDHKGAVVTAHSTNPVPLIMVGKQADLKEGRLADLAPTMLDILGLEIPQEMTGKSLIISK